MFEREGLPYATIVRPEQLFEDPHLLASGGLADPGSWNRYAYVQGDPVNFYDPEGLLMAVAHGDGGGGGFGGNPFYSPFAGSPGGGGGSPEPGSGGGGGGGPAETLHIGDPRKDGENFEINLARAEYWVKKGAKPSETVGSFIKKARKKSAAAAEAADQTPANTPAPVSETITA